MGSTNGRRNFNDSAGVSWTVELRDRIDLLSLRAELMLLFSSPNAFRCVRQFPDDWYHLPDEELERLSWKN